MRTTAVLMLVAVIAGCGGGGGDAAETSNSTPSPSTPSTSAPPATSTPSTGAPTTNPPKPSPPADVLQPLEARRTGGIAGFDDLVKVTPDGTATLTRRDGTTRTCRLDTALRRRLATVDWGAVPRTNRPGPANRSDAMQYVVTYGAAKPLVLDADVPAPGQEQLTGAIAALFSACTD